MPITYGRNLAKSWGAQHQSGAVLMRVYTTHTEDSVWELAHDLDRQGRRVFIDVHDDTLAPGQGDLDNALMAAIENARTMIIVVSDETQGSWWVPWEIGVSTPSGKPRAMYKLPTTRPLPDYLEKLQRLRNLSEANSWVTACNGIP